VEANVIAREEHARNFLKCKDGSESCDYSLLTPVEGSTLAAAEQKRNYTACLKGYGLCDSSRLTPSEVEMIDQQSKPLSH
jgi:hypothetical protein